MSLRVICNRFLVPFLFSRTFLGVACTIPVLFKRVVNYKIRPTNRIVVISIDEFQLFTYNCYESQFSHLDAANRNESNRFPAVNRPSLISSSSSRRKAVANRNTNSEWPVFAINQSGFQCRRDIARTRRFPFEKKHDLLNSSSPVPWRPTTCDMSTLFRHVLLSRERSLYSATRFN